MTKGIVWRAIVAVLLAAGAAAAASIPEIPLPDRDGTLRLAVVGDAGLGTARVARGIEAVRREGTIDGILLVGDNFYPAGVRSLDDPRWKVVAPLVALRIPLFAVLGNHDYTGDPGVQVRADGVLPMWRMPARQYAIRGGVADFAVLDTTPQALGTQAGGEVEAPDLVRSVFATSASRWRIVVGHHTILSSGWHNYAQRDRVRRMRALLPVLDEEQVDLYVCGHDHHEELIGGVPAILISGAGSDPVMPVALHLRTIFPTEIRLVEKIAFALLEITRAELRVRFHDEHGRARSEWLTLSRSPAGLSAGVFRIDGR